MDHKMPLLVAAFFLLALPLYAGYMGVPGGSGTGSFIAAVCLFALAVRGIIALYYWVKKKIIT